MTRKVTMGFVEQQDTKLILPACSPETFEAITRMFIANQSILIEENGMVRQFSFGSIACSEEKKLVIVSLDQVTNLVPSKFNC